MLSQSRCKKSNRSRGVWWSRSTRRTTSTGTTTPRKNTESAIGRRSSKVNNHLLGDGQEVADVAKGQATLGRRTYMYGLATEDIAKSKAKLQKSAHGALTRKQPPPLLPPRQRETYQHIALMPKPTISTEDYSHDEEGGTNTYGGDTYALATATTALPGEVAVTGLISSLRDVFKCVMHVADPQCSAANLMPPRGDDGACGPPANISIPPAPRGINNTARQNQFNRKSLEEDMKSLVRVRLRKPLGITFTSIRNDLKGVCIYDLPEDGKAYRKVKTSLSVGDELLSINGVDMTHRSLEYFINYIERVDTSRHKMDMIFRKLGRARV